MDTKAGKFELIKDYRDGFDLELFDAKYVEYLDKYVYIVGDYASGLLRLKGFSEDDNYSNHKYIPDYILESCTPNCMYYILKRQK